MGQSSAARPRQKGNRKGEVRPLHRQLYRTASWVLVVVFVASSMAALLGSATAASTTYALTGYVDQPGGVTAPPVPAGVTVDLVSRATGAVYTSTVTGSGGQFAFTSSGTSGGLAPGYWGLYVPPVGNVSLTGCKKCGVLPQQQTPVYKYYNYTVLTNANYTQVLTNVSIVPYIAKLNGTVTLNGSGVAGASISLLSPHYDGLVLVNNTTNASGFYNLSVPEGSWVLQVTYSAGAQLYTNSTAVTITTAKPPHVNPVLQAFSISGRIYSSVTNSYITATGNATLFDPVNHYLYSTATPPGGYYAFPSYPGNFSHGNQNFTVVLSPVGFQPTYFAVKVTGTGAITHKATVSPVKASELGHFDTLLNFSTINVTTGKGTLGVSTEVVQGNDSVVPGLPNATVGQLWAQLGLDFNHTLSLPEADVATLENWVGLQGPFFPAVQAGTTVNGTGFVGPKTAQALTSWSSTCSGAGTFCGLASADTVSYGWNTTYTLNGTAPKNASSYTISFNFAHPASGTDVYNYTLALPTDYVLYSNTTAPAQSSLTGKGPKGTWTSFTLTSKQSSSPSGTATFTIVREKNLTANVEISSAASSFTSANIINDSHGYYHAVLGVGENATFSAAKSVYPAGVNGTVFEWYFGDGNWSNVTNITTNHTYHKAGTYAGNLTIISSSGAKNATVFNVSVVTTSPVAGIASNATKYEQRKAGTTPFLFVNWSTTLQFNATATTVATPNNLSISQFTMKARNFSASANFSVGKGANPRSNWTFAFGANTTSSTTSPGHGVYVNFTLVKINGSSPGVTGWGWMYNLTLEVWSLVGTNSTAHLTILVNDSQPPVPKVTLENSAGKAITNSSIVEGTNHIAVVRLNASGSASYGNGSIVKYFWNVNNTNSSFKNFTYTNTSVKPLPTVRLAPRSTDYKIKLTVTDSNGIKANTTVSLEVAANTTLRPVMEANNLTGPSTVNAGTSYTYWVNLTVGGGSKSVAQNVSVSFYVTSQGGTSRTYIGGSPGSVVFYGYSNTTKNATVNSTKISSGVIQSLKYNRTVRAVITWTPSKSGNFILYANATATNQFVNGSSASVASTSVNVKPNPTTTDLEYGAILAAVVAVIAVLYLFYRRRTRKPGSSKPSSSKSGLERSAKRADEDDDDV